MQTVKALFFDVFGTLVDWRTSIAREARATLEPLGISADWSAFADAWRGQYQPAMEDVRSGRLPFSKLDVLHRRNLNVVLTQFGLDRVDEPTRVHLNLAWHRLDAWPDVTAGLARLRARYRLAPCSNGNISLMVDLARRNGFIWDAILGAEVARDYKPKPAVYLASAAAFDCAPAETMMVAAQSGCCRGRQVQRWTWRPRQQPDCAPRSSRARTKTGQGAASRAPVSPWITPRQTCTHSPTRCTVTDQ
jgi:2-haloacid dehalogenase